MGMINKRGYSTGFSWIFGLVSIFGLGILYIVFNQVFTVYLVPTIKAMTNTSRVPPEVVATVFTNIDKFMDYFHAMPYILFLVAVIYMLVAAFRKEGDSQFR
jgi:hypothetical protein